MPWKYTLAELAKNIKGELNASETTYFSGVSIDTRTIQPGEVFFALSGTNSDGHRFVHEAIRKGAVAVVVKKECDVPHIKVSEPLFALQQFARWHRMNLNTKIFAITGSCGKTTSKELIRCVLGGKYKVVATKGNFNNEIGCPLSLLQIDESTDWAVIEMGAGKPGDIAELCGIVYPEESAITCIGPAHLERLGSIEQVALEKGCIAECLPPWGTFYVNTFDQFCISISERVKANKIYYGREGSVVLKEISPYSDFSVRVRIEPFGELILPICSRLSVTNYLLAFAVALKHAVPIDVKALAETAEKMNRVKVLPLGKWYIVDDTYNANPLSMESSLEILSLLAPTVNKYAVLGDMLELGTYSEEYHFGLGKKAAHYGVKGLYLYGNYAKEVMKGAVSEGLENVWILNEHDQIAKKVLETVPNSSWILVKGSRGTTMEKVIEHLNALLQSKEG